MNRYSKVSEPELISLLKTGDELAFTEIYNRYWKKLFVVAANKIDDLSRIFKLEPGAKLQQSQTSLQIFGSAENQLTIGSEVKLY